MQKIQIKNDKIYSQFQTAMPFQWGFAPKKEQRNALSLHKSTKRAGYIKPTSQGLVKLSLIWVLHFRGMKKPIHFKPLISIIKI